MEILEGLGVGWQLLRGPPGVSSNQHIFLNLVELVALERVVSLSLTLITFQFAAIPFVVAVAAIAVITFHLWTFLIRMVWSLHTCHTAFLVV